MKKTGRITALLVLAFFLFLSLFVDQAICSSDKTLSPSDATENVSIEVAVKLAQHKLDTEKLLGNYPSLSNSTVGIPVLCLNKDRKPSVYKVPVIDGDLVTGIVYISAKQFGPPIIGLDVFLAPRREPVKSEVFNIGVDIKKIEELSAYFRTSLHDAAVDIWKTNFLELEKEVTAAEWNYKNLDVPHRSWHCGCVPTTLTMILRYYGANVSEEEFAQALGATPPDYGVPNYKFILGEVSTAVEQVANNHGLTVEADAVWIGGILPTSLYWNYVDEINAYRPSAIINLIGWSGATSQHAVAGEGYKYKGVLDLYYVVDDPNFDYAREWSYWTCLEACHVNITCFNPPVDVFFLVDLSGSFSDDLPNFKAQAPEIINNLKSSNPNTKFGIAKYEDYPINPFGDAAYGDKAYERLVDLTFNSDDVLNIISGLFTRSGKDWPQSQLPALYQAATGAGQDLSGPGYPGASIPSGQQANFRDGAVKVFMIWTDAPFHQPGDPGDIPYPGPSESETDAAILALDPPKVVGIASGSGGIADLERIAIATGAVAPEGGVDCNGDGIIDIAEGEPLVFSISPSGVGIGEAVIALVEAAAAEPDVNMKKFKIVKAKIFFYESTPDAFAFGGKIELGSESDGFDLNEDWVVVQIGRYIEAIPPGSFVDSLYVGTPGSISQMKIIKLPNDSLVFATVAEEVDMDETLLGVAPTSVPISLRIGKNFGSIHIPMIARNNVWTFRDGLRKPDVFAKLDNSLTPQKYDLKQNYPNPFNSETTIRFQLPEANHVVLKIYNIIGQEIRSLVDKNYSIGIHSVIWDGKDNSGKAVVSGMYIYRIEAGDFVDIKKMALIR